LPGNDPSRDRQTMTARSQIVRARPARPSIQSGFVIACSLILILCIAAHADDKNRSQGRLLFGKVLDQQDNPVVGAIVYLTNTRTHAVKSYIVGQDGTYRFPSLSATVDYEVYAQHNKAKSDTKSVSQFDDRSQVYIDLKIDTR
jgi:hypothetical protein